MKYRKKPVVIEAFLWTGGPDQTEDPTWIVEALKKPHIEVGSVEFIKNRKWPDGALFIRTLEGGLFATPGDWIIRGIKGELYPCKPDIFLATYEKVED